MSDVELVLLVTAGTGIVLAVVFLVWLFDPVRRIRS